MTDKDKKEEQKEEKSYTDITEETIREIEKGKEEKK